MTFDRHWLGDVSLAILLTLPLLAFSRPHAPIEKPIATSIAAMHPLAAHNPGNGRISLLG